MPENKVVTTVVTPSYNQGRFIEETIKSVISQEGDFFIEYLVMDGGSTDETVEILKRYETLIKEGKWPVRCRGIEYRWVSEKDNGQADAVNKGFRLARGEILGWLNSDDTYLPGAVGKAVEYLSEHDDVDMVYGEGYHTMEDGTVKEQYSTKPFDIKKLADNCFICQPTVFLRRRVVDEVGLLDTGLHFCMDYDYWIRIGKRLKVGFLPEHLATSRMYAENKTMSQRLDACTEAVMMLKRHYGMVPSSWLFAYTYLRVEKWFESESEQKGLGFKVLWCLYFVIKYLQVNSSFPVELLSGKR